MYNLRTVLEEAENRRVADGHFNVSDWVLLKAVFASAQELKVPVVVGASEGERHYLGNPQLSALVKTLREESEFPIFLNADYPPSLESAVTAARAGFDSIVFDQSELSLEENAPPVTTSRWRSGPRCCRFLVIYGSGKYRIE
jgi:fructose-bisphosphate aldolase, class II